MQHGQQVKFASSALIVADRQQFHIEKEFFPQSLIRSITANMCSADKSSSRLTKNSWRLFCRGPQHQHPRSYSTFRRDCSSVTPRYDTSLGKICCKPSLCQELVLPPSFFPFYTTNLRKPIERDKLRPNPTELGENKLRILPRC